MKKHDGITNLSNNLKKYAVAAALLLIGSSLWAEAGKTAPIIFKASELELLQTQVAQPEVKFRRLLKTFRKAADAAAKRGPFSITYHRPPRPDLDPHDYYSESIYWWPDPRDPKAPYIRRDGQRNPAVFGAHKNALVEFCRTTFILAVAAYLYHDEGYAHRAQELIRVWFLDPKTKMNPHARYAQIIPNTAVKRGVGILDTRHLVLVTEAVAILRYGELWNSALDQDLTNWFSEYLEWLQHSDYGKDERERGNNHSSWYAVQVATYATFVGNDALRLATWDYVRQNLLENQIAADGRQPLELERTRSLDYSIFNLEALGLLARLAEHDGHDLWHYRNKNGATLLTAIDYVQPYLSNSKQWKHLQIAPTQPRSLLILYFASQSTQRSDYLHLFRQFDPPAIENEPLIFLAKMLAELQ